MSKYDIISKSKKKISFAFGFWLMAGKNVDFVDQHFATNGSLEEV